MTTLLPQPAASHAEEIAQGERFGFGENWSRFLTLLNDERIDLAIKSLRDMLGLQSLQGMSFLDIGCGSGLSSLAAKKLGARVVSFDFDPHSVACCQRLKSLYFKDDPDWIVQEGSALDASYLRNLGEFDIVYSWGVLHHTGQMWPALENAALPVKRGGRLFIAIYNDQGGASKRWLVVKRLYNKLPKLLKPLLVLAIAAYWEGRDVLIRLIRLQSPLPTAEWRERGKRGMSVWHDWVDWVGGYPFEVAKPEELFDFYYQRGFHLAKMKTMAGGLGCIEMVLERTKS